MVKPPRQSSKTRRSKRSLPTTKHRRSTLKQFGTDRPRDSEPWGNDLPLPKTANTIRLLLHNVQGIRRGQYGQNQFEIIQKEIERLDVDIFSITELNNHFRILPASDQWKDRIRPLKRNHSIAATNQQSPSSETTLFGGVANIIFQKLSYRCSSSQCDPTGLGRWVSTHCKGRHNTDIRIITGYRPNRDHIGATEAVYSQHERYFKICNPSQPREPRIAFFEDLDKEIQKWLELGNQIILALDANCDVRSAEVTRWIQKWGLTDCHASIHPDLPPVETCYRNQKLTPIDGIWVSASVNCKMAGYLDYGEFHSGKSDHRAIWVDIDWSSSLGYETPPSNYSPPERINTKDPRVIAKYNKFVKQELHRRKITHHMHNLHMVASHRPLTSQEQTFYHRLNNITIDIRQRARKKCRKLLMGKHPFSDRLHYAQQTVRLWDLTIQRKTLKRQVGRQPIRRLSKLLKIPHPLRRSIQYAEKELRQARRAYKQIQRTAIKHRDNFKSKLIRAKAQASKGKQSEEAIEKQLKNIFRQKHLWRQVHRTNPKKPKGSAAYLTYEDTQQQVVHCWEQTDITEACMDEGTKRFSQSESTPFMTNPLVKDFGYLATTPSAENVLNGTYQPSNSTDKYTAKFLTQLRRPADLQPINLHVTPKEYQEAWAKARFSTASHPLTPGYPDYIASSQDPTLTHFETNVLNIPIKAGFTTPTWSASTECVIPKKVSAPAVTKMRIINLLDARFNMVNKIFGRRLVQVGETRRMFPWETYGSRKGRRATECALNKVLTADILRCLRQPAAICCNDAKQCYDRIVHSVASLCMQQLGAPKEIPTLLLGTLAELKRHVRTAFGDSPHHYGGIRLPPLQGICQGNGAGPSIWLIVSAPIIKLLKSEGFGLKFETALTHERYQFSCFTFVDDTDLVDSPGLYSDPDEVISSIQDMLNHWGGGLRATGGALVPFKSYWYLLHMTWKKLNRKWGWYFSTIEDTPGDIFMQDHLDQRRRLERLEPHQARETLGVWTSMDGNQQDNKQALLNKTRRWADQVRTGKLNKAAAFLSLNSTILRSLDYPLMTTSLSHKDCHDIMQPVFQTALPKLGFPFPSFPHRVRHGPLSTQGINIPSIWHRQLAHKIWACITHATTDDLLQKNLQHLYGRHTLELGIPNPLLESDFKKFGNLVTPSWMSHLWQCCWETNLRLHLTWDKLKLYCENDIFLIPAFVQQGYSGSTLTQLNHCRMALKAVTLSDITDGYGKYISQWAWEGNIDEASTVSSRLYHWGQQPIPPKEWWSTWRKAIGRCFTHTSRRTSRIRNPLGPWFTTYATLFPWKWSASQERVFYNNTDNPRATSIFIKTPTRTRNNKFHLSDEVTNSYPADAIPAQAIFTDNNNIRFLGYRQIQSPPTTTPTDPRAWAVRYLRPPDSGYPLAIALAEGTAIAVCDGSYKSGHGTSAFILAPHLIFNHPDQLVGGNICPGYFDLTSMSAYRAELCGYYGVITTIRSITNRFKLTSGSVQIGCDCDNAINILFDNKPTSPSTPHYDLIFDIKEMITASPITFKYKRIKGHLDKKIPFQQLDTWHQLNVACDSLAKDLWARTQKTPTFYHSSPNQPSLWFQQRRLHHWCPNEIQQLIWAEKNYIHFEKKEILESHDINTIDWENAGRALRKMNLYQRLWIPKWACNFVTVGYIRRKRNPAVEDACPYCDATETQRHLLQCPHGKPTTLWTALLSDLRQWMQKQQTDPAISRAIVSGLQGFRNGRSPRYNQHRRVRKALQEQADIGWDQAFCGRLSIRWKLKQGKYYEKNRIDKSADFWMCSIIQRLYKFPWEFWELRKAVLKDKSSPINLRYQHIIDSRIIVEYNQGTYGLQRSQRRWFLRPLESRLRDPLTTKEAWLDQVTLARLFLNPVSSSKIHHIRYYFPPETSL